MAACVSMPSAPSCRCVPPSCKRRAWPRAAAAPCACVQGKAEALQRDERAARQEADARAHELEAASKRAEAAAAAQREAAADVASASARADAVQAELDRLREVSGLSGQAVERMRDKLERCEAELAELQVVVVRCRCCRRAVHPRPARSAPQAKTT